MGGVRLVVLVMEKDEELWFADREEAMSSIAICLVSAGALYMHHWLPCSVKNQIPTFVPWQRGEVMRGDARPGKVE